jgi:hypothetical protein
MTNKGRRSIRGRKLLVARLGTTALMFSACALFPGCNLAAPTTCQEDPYQYGCQDLSVPVDQTAPADLSHSLDLDRRDLARVD